MSIYNHLDYREFLNQQLKLRRKNQPSFTQAAVAERAGIRDTYLTNVLKGRANFNSDQIYALAKQLHLNDDETSFLFLLKEWDQCVWPERKAALKYQIEALRKKALATETHIDAKIRKDEHELVMRYYADPFIKIVHLLLQIPGYARDHKRIEPALNIRSEQLEKIMQTLVDLELIRFVNKKVEVLKTNFHLPKDSPMLLPYQALMRAKCTQRLSELPADARYSFEVTFSATDEVKREIQTRFLAFLKEIEPLVKAAESENAYQMNFDLFPWATE